MIRKPHRYQVKAAFHGAAHGHPAIIGIGVVVLWLPQPLRGHYFYRLIRDFLIGRNAFFKCGDINKGLEGRPWLALRLGRTIEPRFFERPAPHHGHHAPGLRIKRHHGALGQGNLPERQAFRPRWPIALRGFRRQGFHHHDIADIHHILNAARFSPQATIWQNGPRPGAQFFQVQHALLRFRWAARVAPFQPAEPRFLRPYFQHHRQAPFRQRTSRARRVGKCWHPFRGAGRNARHRATPAAPPAVIIHQPIAQ